MTQRSKVRYGALHRAAVISSTLILLTVSGMALIAGAVLASTTLLLLPDQITAYNMLAQRTDLLLAPYESLKNIVIIFDFAAVVVVIASAATLKSYSKRTFHTAFVVLAPIIASGDILLEGLYSSLTQQALTQLPSTMDMGTLIPALQVQKQFNAAYGFWGSPEYNTITNILSWATVGLLIVAALTMKSTTVRETNVEKTESVPEFVPIQKHPTKEEGPMPSGTKFCRYCGAKILRDSKFCEECGSELGE